MNANAPKTYRSKSSAVRAIQKAGLNRVPHTFRFKSLCGVNEWTPVFLPELPVDREYIRSLGFVAEKPLS